MPSPSSRPGAVPPDWNRLRARLGGGLWLPGEAEWERGRRSFNQLYDGRAPAAVAACGTVEHVQACVEVARAAHLPIAARGGGHSYAGYSAPDGGVVVDLRGMSAVEVRPDGTAVVGAGARLIDVYAALAAAGRCLPAGTCPTVGIAGLTLGGGIGVLTRKFGLTCDRLLSAQVVTADGVVRTAAETSEPDLYWALRGGGGGNFGITTSFTFATEPAPDLTVFRLGFPAEAAPAVLGAWQEWVAGIPDELWANVGFSGGSPVRCGMSGCFVGSQAALNPLLDTLFARAGVRPTRRTVRQRGYLDAMRFFTGCAQRPIAQCTPEKLPREAFVASSRVLPAPVRDPAALVALLDGRDGMEVLLDPLGGAVARVDPTATAFPHRQALATIQIYQKTTVDGQVAAARAVAEVREALVGVGARGGYVNYIEAAMPGWSIAYYGGNVSRLGATARRYDPDRVFTFAQSVHRM
ncbi:FAD/FMN-containing dehydrogenase [Actinokineospora iranica]|uniref:FAD/FMN-containing dehydrogenase n=1 Tax=Actinokineospora iranica TaxID=1271860 RepID=A0A1G6Z701_9PSEU|nr:FAD/FMN-containing dehydrogenase [Actinokineospora iranica]